MTHDSLGRYRIERELGRGAMGVVYLARDPQIDRVVAIKTISLAQQDPADELDYRERFLQEARAAGRLSHPAIVTIYDAGEDPETREPYLVMEYVRGEPLSKVLTDAGGRLPVANALQLAHEIAEALAYADSQGVTHGDIKPANILITEDGHAKITDFGVARLRHGALLPGGKNFGSPAYMAPEQLAGGPADGRSDLFSLGVMLYSMLTGFRPFQGNTAETVCFKVMNIEPVPVTSFQAELPPELDRIVARSIAKEPNDRYQSGAEFAQDIRVFMQNAGAATDTAGFLALRSHYSASPHSRQSDPALAHSSRHFLWQTSAVVLLSAVILAASEIRKVLRESDTILAPPARIAVAPPVTKTQIVKIPVPKIIYITKTNVPPPPGPTATMRVEILHHFSAGKVSITVDDHLLLDQDLRGDDQRHPVFRALEMNQVANLQLPPGKHKIQVHVVSAPSDYDQTEDLETEFATGTVRVLYVNCDKRKIQATLQ